MLIKSCINFRQEIFFCWRLIKNIFFFFEGRARKNAFWSGDEKLCHKFSSLHLFVYLLVTSKNKE